MPAEVAYCAVLAHGEAATPADALALQAADSLSCMRSPAVLGPQLRGPRSPGMAQKAPSVPSGVGTAPARRASSCWARRDSSSTRCRREGPPSGCWGRRLGIGVGAAPRAHAASVPGTRGGGNCRSGWARLLQAMPQGRRWALLSGLSPGVRGIWRPLANIQRRMARKLHLAWLSAGSRSPGAGGAARAQAKGGSPSRGPPPSAFAVPVAWLAARSR